MVRPNTVATFWARVDKRGPDECWLWTGSVHAEGYGRFWLQGKKWQTHCLAYELIVGPVPDGLELDHLCHTRDLLCSGGDGCAHRRCVNPTHLEPVTSVENLRRGRSNHSLRTHCPRGHPYDEANTYMRPDRRGRACRKCHNENTKAARLAGRRSN